MLFWLWTTYLFPLPLARPSGDDRGAIVSSWPCSRAARRSSSDGTVGIEVLDANALNVTPKRKPSCPARRRLVAQLGRSVRRGEKLASAGCCTRAPDTSAAAHPRERAGGRRRRMRSASGCRRASPGRRDVHSSQTMAQLAR